MKKVLIILALVAVIGIAAGAFYFYMQETGEQQQEDEAAAAQVAESLVQSIDAVMSKTTPVSWVYDADDTLLFAIRISDEASATQSVTDTIIAEISKKYPEGLANYVARQYVIDQVIAGKSDYFFECLVSQLQSRKTDEDLVKYLTTIGNYGGVNGLENAAVEYFNRDLGHLTSWQIDFLMYVYGKDTADITAYLTSAGMTQEQLDFMQDSVRNDAYETILRKEVQKLSQIQMSQSSYTIRLSLSAAQQQAVQASVDSAMKAYIDLSSSGTFVVNASVAVLDNQTGLITAYVPGRTSSAKVQEEFEMNSGTWSSNFTQLISRLAQPGQTKYSLQTVKLPNGDYTFKSTGQQWEGQELGSGVSGSNTAIDVLDQLKVMVLSSSPSLIQQVKDLNGQTVYEAPGPEFQPAGNTTVLKLRQFFAEDGVDQATTLSSRLVMSSGVVCFEMTKEYTVIALIGTGVISGDVPADERSSLLDVFDAISQGVRTFFPTPKNLLYARTEGVANEFTATYEANHEMLSEGLGEKFKSLEGMEINSVESRKNFELEYEKLSAELKSLEAFVSKQNYAELENELYEIRQARAEVILIYSV